MDMRRILLIGMLLVGSLLPASTAHAAPNGVVVTFDCDNGQSYDVNFGAPRNNSSEAFIVGTNDVLVVKTFEVTLEGEVLASWNRGDNGFEGEDLLSCTGEDPESGIEFALTGFITPR
jgi:hypothetical protein